MTNKGNIINILGILICLIMLTIIPLKVLFPVDFQNADNYQEDLSAFSQNIINSWLIDGMAYDNFTAYCDFASVEFENNNDRCVYLSYPPGSFIPLYLIARATGQEEVSIGFIKHFVQFEYYLSMLLLGILFYLCLKYINVKSRFLIIFLPVLFSSLWAFLPYNVYYMNNVYFADQAVILLSISFFLVEIALYTKQLKRGKFFLQMLSCVILFAGILTDYYFYCIAFVSVCLRIMNNFREHPEQSLIFKIRSNTWPLIVSALVASALFLIQLLLAPNGMKLLMITFLMRTSSGTEWGGTRELAHHFGNGFTVLFIPVLIFVTVFCLVFPLIRRKFSGQKQVIINGLSLIVLSSVLHTIVLREHSIIHPFSMLKYNLVFVSIIFVFFCWLYVQYQNAVLATTRKYLKASLTLTVCFIILFILGVQSYNQNFYRARMNAADHSIARFIRVHTNYYDVVYSPDYEIPWNPPQDLAISKKRIYPVSALHEIPYSHLSDQAVINILLNGDSMKKSDWNKLIGQKQFFTQEGNLYLFKIPKKSFASVIN